MNQQKTSIAQSEQIKYFKLQNVVSNLTTSPPYIIPNEINNVVLGLK
ncbi:MAG: hypothetical protein V3U87_17820 [Methylococcaceae bacterium]